MTGSISFLLLLRLAHILGGVLWVGSVVFLAAFLGPSIAASGPAGGRVMQHVVGVRRLPTYLMTAAVLTVLSGVALYWRNSVVSHGVWARSHQGMTFGLGGAIAIVVAVLGIAFSSPATKRLVALGQTIQSSGGPPSPEQALELAGLQTRVGRLSRILAVLLLLSAATMAVARYL